MPKNIEDIIVPERKRSIRDIPIPEGRRRIENYETTPSFKENHSSNNLAHSNCAFPPKEARVIGRGRGKRKWLAFGVAFLILMFAVFSMFNGATLAYIPKSQAVSFGGDSYTASKDGEGELLYSIVKLSLDKGLEASASGEEEVKRRASGVIAIYNAGASEQRFRATTRFETPDGKIYQVQDAITIPGKKVVGGVDNPGVLEVTVYAENPGKEFNIGLTDFTLPGLKGTSLASSVYARSKTVMSGGFAGVEKVVKSEDKAQIKAQLEIALKEELNSEAKAQVPEDFILLPSLSSITFEDLPQTESTTVDSVKINMHAELFGVMFKRSDLSNRLVLNKITLTPGESVDIVGLDSLNFTFPTNVSANTPTSNEIKFVVKGEAVIVWRIDEVALKTDLIGKHKRDIPSILNNYPTIVSASATIRPFWKSSFPEDSADIFLKKLPIQ
ncbi:MAG: hypothetical protein Q7K26_04160 [bacterium]|nr:hypothetical protein [bacterium]